MKLLSLGVDASMSPYLQRKTRMTNQVAIMCAFIGFFYAFFIYAHYPPLVIYPGGLFLVSCGVLLLNYLRFVKLARFICAFEMLTHATLFHASIIQQGEPFLIPFFCSMLAMTLIPWLLYDFREKEMLVLTLVICFGLLFAQEWFNALLEVPVDVTYFRESYLTPMTYAFAVAIQVVCMIALKLENQAASTYAVSTKEIAGEVLN
ncbi:MAG: hypothetical protein RIG62_14775 [Cyclobacteriaceae bacterium]